MATTTNYGWTTPDDTALVKDGASAIRTLGSSVDSTLKTQVDNTVASSIQKSVITTTGDIIYASGASTPARLGIGSSGQVLQVSGGLPAWGTAPSGGITQIATTTASASASVTFSSISSAYRNLYIVVQNFIPVGNGDNLNMRINGATTNYFNGTTYASNNDQAYAETSIQVTSATRNSSASGMSYIFIPNYATTASTKITNQYAFTTSSITAGRISGWTSTGYYNSTAAISSISFQSASATFSGVFTLYGVQ